MSLRVRYAHDRRVDGISRAAALAGVLAPIVTLVGVVAASRGVDGYSHVRDHMSELGARSAPRAEVFETSHWVTAALMLVFLAGVRRRVPWDWKASVLFGVATVATVGIGVVRCSAGCPGPTADAATRDDLVHTAITVVDLLAVVLLPFAVAHIGLGPGWRRLRRVSWITGGLLLLLGSLVVVTSIVDARRGLAQRAFFVVAWLWLILIACGVGSRRIRYWLGAYPEDS